MSLRAMIDELLAYNAWANERVLGWCADVPEEAFDRPFLLGAGSLRATLHHIADAEQVWLDRWRGTPSKPEPMPAGLGRREIVAHLTRLHEQRTQFLAPLDDGALCEKLVYANSRGETYSHRLVDLLLHVSSHGVHHRAQALNMLRVLGAKVGMIDYLARAVEHVDLPSPTLHLALLRRCYTHGDWGTQALLETAAGMNPSDLDERFDVGPGTLRKTLLHIYDAEHYWLENYVTGSVAGLGPLSPNATIPELRERWDTLVRAREEYFDTLAEPDLLRALEVQAPDGRTLRFVLGQPLLQLWLHGGHHRAQALNMLRRLGLRSPELDFLAWLRAAAPRGVNGDEALTS